MVPALYEYFQATVIKAEEEKLIANENWITSPLWFHVYRTSSFPSIQVLRIVWLDMYEIVMLRLTQQDPLR